MPYKKRYGKYKKRGTSFKRKKYGRKRRFFKRRRRPNRNNGTMIGRNHLFSAFTVVKLRFVDHISLDPVAGTAATHIYSPSQIQDPDVTGTGMKPRGTNEMFNLYNNALTIGSKASIQWTNTDTDEQQYVGILSTESNTAPVVSKARDYMENGATFKLLAGASDGSRNIWRQTKKFSMRKDFRIVHPFDEEDIFGHVNGAVPTRLWHWRLWAGPCDGTQETAGVDVCIFIQFIVVFYNPRALAEST